MSWYERRAGQGVVCVCVCVLKSVKVDNNEPRLSTALLPLVLLEDHQFVKNISETCTIL